MTRFRSTVISGVIVVSVAAVLIALISNGERNDAAGAESSARESSQSAPSPLDRNVLESKFEKPAVETTPDFNFDIDRLYDPAYEVDPALVEFADSHGISPTCLIARVKAHMDQLPLPKECVDELLQDNYAAHRLGIQTHDYVCDEVDDVQNCRMVRVREHPYDEFSDTELRYLADSSAEASYLLAVRLGWDEEAGHFYEQAVALSGKSGPLHRFLMMENASGITYTNGELQVAKAKITYEVLLVMDWLGWPGDKYLRDVEEALVSDGHDIEPIRRLAEARYNRISWRRMELLGRGWD